VQQRGHPAFAVAHAEVLLDPMRDLFGRKIERGLQVGVQERLTGSIQPRLAAAVGHVQQMLDAALLVSLEIGPRGIGFHQQRLRHLFGRPAGAE
jgi:hypothetical protein